MKKLLLILVLLMVSFKLQSQGLEETFLTILDEYIVREPQRKNFDKDSILLSASILKFDEGENDFLIGLSMYWLSQYPIMDSLQTYRGIKMVVKYPQDMSKELSKHFKSIKDTRTKKEEFAKRPESVCNYSFQVNRNNEIYFIIASTKDDKYYYKRLKKRKLKFTKNLKFTKDIYQNK